MSHFTGNKNFNWVAYSHPFFFSELSPSKFFVWTLHHQVCHTYSKFEHDPCIKDASLSETAKSTWKSTTSTISWLQLEIFHLFQIERCIAPLQLSIFQPDLIGLSYCFHYHKMHPKIIKKHLYVCPDLGWK